MNWKNRWLAFVLLVMATLGARGAAVDGTNIVSVMSDNVNNANNVLSPLTLGLLMFGVVISLAVWFIAKGRKGR